MTDDVDPRTQPCAGCLGTRSCWVCLGTGLGDVRPHGHEVCRSCLGTRRCRYCHDDDAPRRRAVDAIEP